MNKLKKIALLLGFGYAALLLLDFTYIKVFGQTPAQSLTVVLYSNITSASRLDGCDASHPCIDNRSQFTRQSSISSYRAYGTGTWSVDMQFADGAPTSWISFGSTGVVTQAGPSSGIGYGIGPGNIQKSYHDYIRFVITGNVTIMNYTGTRQFWWLPSVAAIAFPLTPNQGGTGITFPPFSYPQANGAICNGTTDDSSAINTLLATGVNVFFPTGTCAMASPMQLTVSGQHISCSSNGGTVIKFTGSGSGVVVAASIRGVTIDGPCNFQTSNSGGTLCVDLSAGSNAYLELHYQCSTSGSGHWIWGGWANELQQSKIYFEDQDFNLDNCFHLENQSNGTDLYSPHCQAPLQKGLEISGSQVAVFGGVIEGSANFPLIGCLSAATCTLTGVYLENHTSTADWIDNNGSFLVVNSVFIGGGSARNVINSHGVGGSAHISHVGGFAAAAACAITLSETNQTASQDMIGDSLVFNSTGGGVGFGICAVTGRTLAIHHTAVIAASDAIINTGAENVVVDTSSLQSATGFAINDQSNGGGIIAHNNDIQVVGSTAIQNVVIVSGGSGYVNGDIVTLVQGGASGGKALIIGVAGGGVAAIAVMSAPGTGYSVASGLSTTGGSGTGLTISVTAVGAPTFGQFSTNNGDIQFNNTLHGTGYITSNFGAQTFASVTVNGGVNTVRPYFWTTSGAKRFNLFASPNPEAGGDAGSYWSLDRYADDGTTNTRVFDLHRDGTGWSIFDTINLGGANNSLNLASPAITTASGVGSCPMSATICWNVKVNGSVRVIPLY